jgi:hypothetical protein
MKTAPVILAATLLASALIGCGQSANRIDAQVTPVSIDGSRFMLAEEPDGAIGVIAARESVKDGDSIVIVGRIGGDANPWVEGRAAFTLLDASKSLVALGTESAAGELCTGDCCAIERAGCTTLVKFVDENGRVLAADARRLLNVSANDMVVVRGKASRDENGNFAVLADGLHNRE